MDRLDAIFCDDVIDIFRFLFRFHEVKTFSVMWSFIASYICSLQKQHYLSTSVLITVEHLKLTVGNLESSLAAMNMPIRAIRSFSAGIELRQYNNCQRRFFSVKELSWCAPNKPPVRQQPANTTIEEDDVSWNFEMISISLSGTSLFSSFFRL